VVSYTWPLGAEVTTRGVHAAAVLVVAAAIISDGRVLAARRSRPPHLAGGWEFPGGKVEDGETESAALVRECREELSVGLVVDARLGAADDGDLRLVLYKAVIADGDPVAGSDHDLVRWLSASELEDVEWLPVDRELLPLVSPLLR